MLDVQLPLESRQIPAVSHRHTSYTSCHWFLCSDHIINHLQPPVMQLSHAVIGTHLLPLPAENSSEYVPFPRMTRSPDLSAMHLSLYQG